MVITTLLLSIAAAFAKSPPKTVMFGDSITESWKDAKVFDKNTVNHGISGNTTAQMRERFQKDVLDEKPEQVHFLMGTNDIAENGGPYSLEKTKANIEWMAKRAKEQKIKVILASVLPAASYSWRPSVKNSAAKIKELNAWIKEFASKEKFTYVDYFQAMSTADGALKKEFSDDGVHPNGKGYAAMQSLAVKALGRLELKK